MEKKAKVVELSLNNDFLDKIINQLNEMKTNHNKIVKLASGDKNLVLVITHSENELRKKVLKGSEKQEVKAEKSGQK